MRGDDQTDVALIRRWAADGYGTEDIAVRLRQLGFETSADRVRWVLRASVRDVLKAARRSTSLTSLPATPLEDRLRNNFAGDLTALLMGDPPPRRAGA